MKLLRWLFGVTRPVLSPLLLSITARILDQLAGIAIVSYAAWLGLIAIMRVWTFTIGPLPSQWEAFLAAASPQLTLSLESAGLLSLIISPMIILAAFKAWMRYEEQFRGHLVAFRSLELLRTEAFRSLYPQAPAVLQTANTGEVFASVTKDIDRIEVFFAHTIAPSISAIAVPFITLVVFGQLTSYRTVILGIMIVLVAQVVVWFLGVIGNRSRAILVTKGEMSQHMVDTIQGAREIVGYQFLETRLRELSELNERVAKDQRTEAIISGLQQGLLVLLRLAIPLAILAPARDILLAQPLLLPAVIAVILGTWRMWELVEAVQDFSIAVQTSWAAAGRVYDLAHQPPRVSPDGKTVSTLCHELSSTLTPQDPANVIATGTSEELLAFAQSTGIVFEDVQVTSVPTPMRPAVSMLTGVNAAIPLGAWTTIVGHTGSGKTTLSGLLVRSVDPDGGGITLAGMPLTAIAPDSLRDHVVLVPQLTELFSGSVRTNLCLADPEASDEDLWEVLDIVELTEAIRALPEGLDTDLKEAGGGLSGGQRQRLGLARSLLRRPDVLILDEYAAHLNPDLEARVHTRLAAWMAGKTVVEVSHHVASAERADWVIVMRDGGVGAQGRPADALAVF